MAETPTPLASRGTDIPPSLADLVMRCLSKSPDDRPASAAELLDHLDTAYESHERVSLPPAKRSRYSVAALALGAGALLAIVAYAFATERWTRDASSAQSSVAVLPFSDTQADSANAYFGEGIADELMTALGKVPGLRVASRTSSIAIGTRRDIDVREIGRLLGVSAVVEGTVRRAGGQLRVTAQLTSASDGLTLWSESYEREDKDVFAVQNEITQAIVTALRPELAGSGRSLAGNTDTGAGTTDPEAYDLYLRGLYLLERRGAGVAQSADYFSQAIEKDPSFARAHAGLASALAFFPYFAGVPADRVEARVRVAAERSLQLDPTLAEPKVALAMAHWHAYRWKEADQEFRRAIAADSTSAAAHTQYGRYLLGIARIDDAIREFRIARRLDPLAPTSSMWLSHSLAYNGDFGAALEEGKRARELDPNLLNNRTILIFDLIRAGLLGEARAIVVNDKLPAGFVGMRANALELLGEKAQAASIRQDLDARPDTTWMVHTARAYAYLATSDTARVLAELEEGYARREIVAQMMPLVDRLFDPVRQTARFAALVRKWRLEGRGLTEPNGGRAAQ